MKIQNNFFRSFYTLYAIRYTLSIFLLLFSLPVWADDQNRSVGVVQAQQDYREFLKQLKEINQQYQKVTGEIKKTLKEEGVPEFDEETGQLNIKPYVENEAEIETARVVRQSKEDMTVQLELPGLKKESIVVKVEDGQFLRINADKKSGIPGKHLEKLISLPAPAKEEGAQASYEDGILTVKILKAAKKEVSIPVR